MNRTSHKLENLTTQSSLVLFLHNKDKSIFFDKIAKTDYCWPWQGIKNKAGYGLIFVHDNHVLAHRISYEIHKGPIGDKLVCHRCDYRDCVNPDHLFLGTASENFLDMYAKGRNSHHIYRTGDSRSTFNKLTDDEVLFIHRFCLGKSSESVASRFNISGTVIRDIRSGKYPRIKRLILEKYKISEKGMGRLKAGLRSK